MVRFTLKDTRKSSTLRLELGSDEDVSEIRNIASEYWGDDGCLIRNGYRLIRSGGSVGECIREGDLVELIPDPSAFRF